jgi:hypothetical protein
MSDTATRTSTGSRSISGHTHERLRQQVHPTPWSTHGGVMLGYLATATKVQTLRGTVALDTVTGVRTIVRTGDAIPRRNMTAPTNERTRIARDSQEARHRRLTAWTEIAERYAKNFDAGNPLLSADDAQAAVATGYDLAAKLLAGQHAFASTVVGASKQDSERITQSAPSFAPFPTA